MSTPPRPSASSPPAAAGLLLGLGGVALAAFAGGATVPEARPAAEAAAAAPAARPIPRPPPTEYGEGFADSRARKKARKEWIAARHRAAPGTDWKEVERRNGRDLMAQRRPGGPPPEPPPGLWVERGSDNQAGRMHAGRTSLDGNTLFAGSDRGGVWAGAPDGTGWAPIGDDVYGGAHFLWPRDPGTAGPDRLTAATAWTGVHTSADLGATWATPAGLPPIWMVRQVMGSSADLSVLYLLSTDYWTWHLSRSVDGGASYTVLRTWEGAGAAAEGDLWAPRDGTDALYFAHDGVLERSLDRGDTWEVLGSLAAPGQNLRLAGSEAGAPDLYALASGGGLSDCVLWRSTDGGAAWEEQGALPDCWNVVAASIVDPRVVAYGGVELHVSRDAGESFAVVNGWGDYYGDPANKLHADMMALVVEPVAGRAGERWFIGTDGGLYQSDDRLGTVRNLSLQGLRVSQYYDTLTSAADPSHVAAGSQDQGFQVTQGVAQAGEAYAFNQILSGDYGHLSSTDGTHAIVYAPYPGFLLVSIGEDEPALAYVDFPGGQNRLWLPPVVADPRDPEAVFLVGDPLMRATRSSDWEWSWERWSEPVFGSDGYETLSALGFSPADPARAIAVTSYGRAFTSADGARTWTPVATGLPGGQYFYGTALAFDPLSPDTVYLGGAGYEGPAVYRSTDGGASWEPWGDGLPPTLVYALTVARDGSGRVFAGTETGAWASPAGEQADWADVLGGEAPITTYWSVEALAHENTLRFGTYGRGIWDLRLDTPACYPAVDADADGVPCTTDCADDDPARAPGLPDIAGDGIDQDCDGEDTPASGGDGSADGGGGPAGDEKPTGCGCATPPRAPGAAVALGMGALVLVLRRRRR